MALAPGIAESRFLERPIELPERLLWSGMGTRTIYAEPTRPEELTMATIPIVGSLVNRGAWIGASSGLVSYEYPSWSSRF